jgi:hypothetical protein
MFPNTANILHHIRGFIDTGIQTTFSSIPPPNKHLPNSSTILTHPKIIHTTITEFLNLSFIHKLDFQPSHTHPLLLVLKPNKQPRLCIDLSQNYNDFVHSPDFSYQSILDLIHISSPNCFYASIDISKCFLSFPLNTRTAKHITFLYKHIYYRFNRMPFGLKPAPSINEMLLGVVSFALRLSGVRHVRYCDDLIIVSKSYSSCLQSFYSAIHTIQSFGLSISKPKLVYPTQDIIFIGFGINSVTQILYITDEKALDIVNILSSLSAKPSASLHDIQSICGKLNHISFISKGLKPFTRSLIDLTKSHPRRITFSTSHLHSMKYIINYLPISHKSCPWSHNKPAWIIKHDASLSGFGSHIVRAPANIQIPHNQHYTCGIFDDIHIHHHNQICYAELFAIFASLYKYTQLSLLHSCTVQIITDNIADVFILRKHTTKNRNLLYLLQLITHLCNTYDIYLITHHIPGKNNIIADFLSRPKLHEYHLPLSYSSDFTQHTDLINTSTHMDSLYKLLTYRPFPFSVSNPL